MQHASGKDYDPSAWAKQRQERIKRALQVGALSPTRVSAHYVRLTSASTYIRNFAFLASSVVCTHILRHLPSTVSFAAWKIKITAFGQGAFPHRHVDHYCSACLSSDCKVVNLSCFTADNREREQHGGVLNLQQATPRPNADSNPLSMCKALTEEHTAVQRLRMLPYTRTDYVVYIQSLRSNTQRGGVRHWTIPMHLRKYSRISIT